MTTKGMRRVSKVEFNGQGIGPDQTSATGFVAQATRRGTFAIGMGTSIREAVHNFRADWNRKTGTQWNDHSHDNRGIALFERKPSVVKALAVSEEQRREAQRLLAEGNSRRVWAAKSPKGTRYLRVVRFMPATAIRQPEAHALECDARGRFINVVRFFDEVAGEMRTQFIRATVSHFGTAYRPLKTLAATSAVAA